MEPDWMWWKTQDKLRIFWGWKTNNCTKSDVKSDKIIKTNFKHFEVEKQTTAQRTWLKLVKE